MFLNFITPNFIPEENQREMYMQKRYICRLGRTSNTRILYVTFPPEVCEHIGLITQYYLKTYFGVCVFL